MVWTCVMAARASLPPPIIFAQSIQNNNFSLGLSRERRAGSLEVVCRLVVFGLLFVKRRVDEI
jgi:hypothetical protein